MNNIQLCHLSTISSGENLFQHVVHAKGYRGMVHLGLTHCLSILYQEETKPPKNKRISVYNNIQSDITNCYTFCIKM